MKYSPSHDSVTMIVSDMDTTIDCFAKDVDTGLTDDPKHLPCIYFYDYQGSLLFEKICQLEEYYLTRAETEILRTHTEDIIAYLPEDAALVELGSGSSTKTRILIQELLQQRQKLYYSPIDVSEKMLIQSSINLSQTFPNLKITSVAAEYDEGLHQLDIHSERPKFIIWLGSSIGNYEQDDARDFLGKINKLMGRNDFFLIGFDLQKDKRIIEKAYNDSEQVTAQFNLNLLARINRELGGEFDLGKFSHEVFYNESKNCVEMHLRSSCKQEIAIADLDNLYMFDKGETIHTENSFKYSLEQIDALAAVTGLEIVDQWFDRKSYFNVTLFQRSNG